MQKYFFLQHFYFNFKRKIDDDIILFYIIDDVLYCSILGLFFLHFDKKGKAKINHCFSSMYL